MKFFAKIVKNYNYFSKALYLRSLTGFWIRISLNKYLLTCRMTSLYVLYDDTYLEVCLLSQGIKYLDCHKFRHINVLFRHIQSYCGIFSTLCNSCIFRALPYSKLDPLRWFINRLLDLIWITGILFMTNQIMSHLKTKLLIFNKKLALQYTMNWVWNL